MMGLPGLFGMRLGSWLAATHVVWVCATMNPAALSFLACTLRIGPKPPAFLTLEAMQVVVDKFGLKLTDNKNPQADVQAMLQGA
jgi:hypothetical protein